MMIRIWDSKNGMSKNRLESSTSVFFISVKNRHPGKRKEERKRSDEYKPFDGVSLYSCASCCSQIAATFLELGLSVYWI